MSKTFCVRLEIHDDEARKVFWDAHGKGEIINGCKVTGLSWDDLFEEPKPKCAHCECSCVDCGSCGEDQL